MNEDALISQINCFIDACLPSCRARREFMINWKLHDIDRAYEMWRNNFTLKNICFLPKLLELIAEASQRKIKPK